MLNRNCFSMRFAAALVVTLLSCVAAQAGGPLALRGSGDPYLWPDGGQAIPFNPDRGGLGLLDNASAVAAVEAAFGEWAAVPSSSADYLNAGLLPVDVDVTNFIPFISPLAPDGLSALVFDEDGSIFNFLFGPGSGILGFSGPEWVNPTTGEILEGVSFFNGGAFLGGFPLSELPSLLVHEFGHFTNLAHTVVNGEVGIFGDEAGPTPFDTFPPIVPIDLIETMYPFILVDGGQGTPHADDVAILSTLYPAPDFFATTGTIQGAILAPDGATRLSGINVIARNVADPYADAVSAISGDFTDSSAQSDPLAGVYTLNGLTPAADYAVYVDQILAGGFSTPIVFPLPGPEELYNGANESADPDVDLPSEFTPVASVAGTPTTGVDIIFNTLGPGPIPIGDDAFVELFLPFTFEFCGEGYDSVYVNSNGSLSFALPSTSFLESASSFLGSMPRIAGMWDDLNPAAGGVVSFSQSQNLFSVRWDSVPEFFATGANTFEITLHRSSNQIDIAWGDISATDGLAGVSCGGSVTTGLEPETDLSTLVGDTANGRNSAATWEIFSFDNDLDNLTLEITAPNTFKDLFEPNDSVTQARRESLPYNSEDDYTAISPAGGDVDFYRFRVDANTTLVAETLPGNFLDTLMGLFDVNTGELLAVDDDGGAGLLSRIIYPADEDRLVALAVTTFPDFGFTGAGNGSGRYVVDISAIDGLLLNLGDDNSVEVDFQNFEFPFQGSNWSSVFVNSNGNFTFGEGDSDFSESVTEFLQGPPRIAALWDDLSPNNGGRVSLSRDAASMTVTFEEVPEWFSTGANTFSVTMFASGDIDITYGATNGNDALVGVTGGGGATDPGETDLSAGGGFSATGTTYEQFSVGEFDLDGSTLLFVGL